MDLPLITKVLNQINVAAYGTYIIAALILVVHASNFGIMDKVKYKLNSNKLSDFLEIMLCCTLIANWVSSNDWTMLGLSNFSISLA